MESQGSFQRVHKYPPLDHILGKNESSPHFICKIYFNIILPPNLVSQVVSYLPDFKRCNIKPYKKNVRFEVVIAKIMKCIVV
jgi:hypothetical protein